MDELEQLRNHTKLSLLLGHYVNAAAADRDAWLDRCMRFDNVNPPELSRLHGELIAQGWLEQNTGVVAHAGAGICAACYRATSEGRRALQQSMRAVAEERCEAA